MANIKLATDKPLMPDAVRVLLCTILFHRVLGPINPKTAEVYGVSYVVPDLADLERDLKDKLQALSTQLNTREKATVTLRFFDPRSKKAWFWSSDSCWEEWVIRCTINNGDMKSVHFDLTEQILKIVQVMDQRKEHIPPITSTDAVVFPYEIRVN